MRFFAFVLFLVLSCSASAGSLPNALPDKPESWSNLDPDALNAQIELATEADESWVFSPLLITLHLFGHDQDTRSLVLKEQKNRGECADATTVLYIRDGFLDDSVRGEWREIKYHRQPDGTWRVEQARVAYRCWRAPDPKAYRAGPCP
jgi:hypothetical protein